MVFGTTSAVQTVDKSPLYGHLLTIKEKHLRKSILSDFPITAKSLVDREISDHISDHMLNL